MTGSKKIRYFGVARRQSLIDKEDKKVSLRQQCRLLGLVRSRLYYKPVGISDRDRVLMNLLDQQYTKTPFWGVRNMRRHLHILGYQVGRDHTRTLLRKLGLTAVFAKPNLSRPKPEYKIYPYLLKDVAITRPNQVWSADITYIRLDYGFAYLVAVLDWYSRLVLSWRLSNTLDALFCVEALEEAIASYGKSEIFNTDQGSQFTGREFTGVLTQHGITISMDGKGRTFDNIFVERFWRTVKYENVYLHGYQNIPEAKEGLKKYFEFLGGTSLAY